MKSGTVAGLQNGNKKTYVRAMFNSIAPRYDFLNHLLSLGVDYYWRRAAVRTLAAKRGAKILDVAAGTGDLSFALLKSQPRLVVGLDPARKMLERFDDKLKKKDEQRIKLVYGDVEHLALRDNSFDAVTAAFGVRNFADMRAGLSEMYRVLKTHGKIVVLEFSQPKRFPIRQLYFLYFRNILPIIGRAFSRNGTAYRYLPRSVSSFPERKEFVRILQGVGFTDVASRTLSFGIATIYLGTKAE